MIEIKEINIEQALQKAKTKAIEQGKRALLSIAEPIAPIDPILFFQSGSQYQVPRTFWSSADHDFFLVGIGNEMTLHANNDTYRQISVLWQELLEHTVVEHPFSNQKVGPIAFGGFPFDADTNQYWQGFEGSQFRVPRFLLTKDKDHYFLTINVMVEHDEDIETLSAQLVEDKQYLLSAPFHPLFTNAIASKQEKQTEEWKQLVRQATAEIRENKMSKVVLARQMEVTYHHEIVISQVLEHLRREQKNSYLFAWETEDACFVGATPERLVRVDEQHLLSTCLAGTAPRGESAEKDEQMGSFLMNDQKNRREHQFVVDMIQEAVRSFAENVHIPDEPQLYRLKNLQHLYTPVRAKLRDEYTILDVVAKLHPTPALSGFPRLASLHFIRKYEQMQRGWYGAPIGWIDQDFNGEFAVAIRSALVNKSSATLFAGCGVVEDSDPDIEFSETTIKFTPMLQALGGL
ncbi:menaquinone-specific isochorismate synthase [Gracilibacillus halophilus YIM-C55.5]|uniref:Isochorismate synthase MenF n=1 Tax=Gracilibacillus halophilus YIM-C55.5 TaxID=1308866 RepID=N4WLU2_9BACI|nr:isochorismate synthase [Gracilibacillus halophilus]ENH97117.1 menaquinone-specific isochorismate synthase [Gracilibacillus halophilus YIM-C55.5]